MRCVCTIVFSISDFIGLPDASYFQLSSLQRGMFVLNHWKRLKFLFNIIKFNQAPIFQLVKETLKSVAKYGSGTYLFQSKRNL